MDHHSIPEHPVTVTVDTSKPVERAFFFERDNGTVIYVNEVTAWSLISKGQQHIRQGTKHFKYLGQSDGVAYAQALKEANVLFKTEGLEAAQKRLKEGVEAEVENAKLNQRPPRNFDEVDLQGNPIKISELR